MLIDEQGVDFLKLFCAVRKNGRYDSVLRNGLWDLVAKESELGSNDGSNVKLLFVEYLDALEKRSKEVVDQSSNFESGLIINRNGTESCQNLIELQVYRFKELLPEIPDLKKEDEMLPLNLELNNTPHSREGILVNLLDEVKREDENHDDDDENRGVIVLDSLNGEEKSINRKRKRECTVGMLNWVIETAKNPCDPAIGLLPERWKWKSYGNDVIWKLVLGFREEILVKRSVDSGAEQSSPWQKYQKMHPCMYEDELGTGYNLRDRLRCDKRLLSSKKTSEASLMDDQTNGDDYVPNFIPLGADFQAEVPEWASPISESDSKWLGTQVWPMEKMNPKFQAQNDPIGMGRQEKCRCRVPSSIECVRLHIAEKRFKVKLELGRVFMEWKFDKMGEEVACFWTKKEEEKFKEIVRLNPASLEKCFWDSLSEFFLTKSRKELVSYYFNVFVLHRRGYQNRFSPDYIDSEDDEFEPESGS